MLFWFLIISPDETLSGIAYFLLLYVTNPCEISQCLVESDWLEIAPIPGMTENEQSPMPQE